MLGPFKIQKVISPTAVRLTLPKGWRIHNSFHISFIEPYRAGNQVSPDPDQVLRKADPIKLEYYVQEIMDSIDTEGDVKYLIKWQGWPAKKHWTWEPYDQFDGEGAKAMVTAFHQRQPLKPVSKEALEVLAKTKTQAES